MPYEAPAFDNVDSAGVDFWGWDNDDLLMGPSSSGDKQREDEEYDGPLELPSGELARPDNRWKQYIL
jgi:hypothetical protein